MTSILFISPVSTVTGDYKPGVVYSVDDTFAAQMIAAGWAQSIFGEVVNVLEVNRLYNNGPLKVAITGSGIPEANGVYSANASYDPENGTEQVAFTGPNNNFITKYDDGVDIYFILYFDGLQKYYSPDLVLWSSYAPSYDPSPTGEVTPYPIGQLVRVVDQGGRIEQYLGGDSWNNDNWLVLKNTIALSVENATGSSIEINGITCEDGSTTFVGYVNPQKVAASGSNFSLQIVDTFGPDSAYLGGFYFPSPNTMSGSGFSLPLKFQDRCPVTIQAITSV